MKRILYLTILLLFVSIISCREKDEERACSLPLPELTFAINKTSKLYKEFINEEGKIDKANISLYKILEGEKKAYEYNSYETTKAEKTYLYISVTLPFSNDVYTGKIETLYLQNATKTYKIEVNGYMKDTECGKYAVTNEIRVDGTKIEVPYLAK